MRGQNDSHYIQKDRQLTGDRSLITQGTKICSNKKRQNRNQNPITYEVVISAPNPDLKLKPGLTATVSIYTLEKNNVLTIPPKALKFMPDQALAEANGIVLKPIHVDNSALQKTVWVKNGQTLEEKEVQTATATTSLLEITGGLAEGDEIVVAMEQSGKKAMGTPQPGETESSPFMPKPPGQDKKSKK